MPISPTYPGVYIEEISSGVRTITGVPTSITAFVGRARRGPVGKPFLITSFSDYQRIFGGLWSESTMSYAVQQYYLNGGSEAVILRLARKAEPSVISLDDGPELKAVSEGDWGNNIRARVDVDDIPSTDKDHYNLTVRDMVTGTQERYVNISKDINSARALDRLLMQSELVRASKDFDKVPKANADIKSGEDPFADKATPPTKFTPATAGSGKDGDALDETIFDRDDDDPNKPGMYALEKVDIFNILCLPPLARDTDIPNSLFGKAAKLCLDKRAMLIVDTPADWNTHSEARDNLSKITNELGESKRNAAIYFPRILMPDPEKGGLVQEFAPSGAIAGIYARTDVRRGVWKAPAGTEAALNGVPELSVPMTDPENGQLNPVGLNSLRNFPVVGNVVWGARTAAGADRNVAESDWKYVPIRRLALYIEESLYRGTQWVVFEPNDEPLWAQIRLSVGAFMHNLFRQGAFQGKSPREAYLVKCDKEANPQSLINLGIVNIIVGFAPLKPAEFVIIKIQQLAGQVES